MLSAIIENQHGEVKKISETKWKIGSENQNHHCPLIIYQNLRPTIKLVTEDSHHTWLIPEKHNRFYFPFQAKEDKEEPTVQPLQKLTIKIGGSSAASGSFSIKQEPKVHSPSPVESPKPRPEIPKL